MHPGARNFLMKSNMKQSDGYHRHADFIADGRWTGVHPRAFIATRVSTPSAWSPIRAGGV
jgi:hypothetical protein